MSSNRILKNSSIAILYEIIAIAAGLIVPRLILGEFGSSYNGVVSSVTQFLSFVVLLRAGIGGVSKAYLYKSLKDNDTITTSKVMHATKDYMNKVCAVFIVGLVLLAIIYPFIVVLNWISTSILVLICGLGSLFENYFGITNMILLQADRREYIISCGNIAATIVNVILTVALINAHCSIHVVKFGNAMAFSLCPLFLFFYVRNKYVIDYSAEYEKDLLVQKKDAFVHVLAEFIHRNTDVIVLTLLTNTLIVSVYTIYAIVINGLRKLTSSFTSNIESVLGRIYSSNSSEYFYRFFLDFEYAIFVLGTFVYSCCGLLFTSFIGVYTAGITDINYILPLYAVIISIAEFFDLAKTPYQFAIRIAGRFKETKYISVAEALINITISVILVRLIGIVGVAVGTLVAMIWRTLAYSIYVNRTILNNKEYKLHKYCIMAIGTSSISYALSLFLRVTRATSYFTFFIQSVVVGMIVAISLLAINIIFYRQRFLSMIRTIKMIIKNR